MKKILSLIVLLTSLSYPVSILLTQEAVAQTPAICPTTLNACRYNYISTSTTTTVKTGAGILHSITIDTKGASSNTATIYDNTAGSGTVIATIDTTSNVQTILFDVGFQTGLTIVTATGTAADITVSYN